MPEPRDVALPARPSREALWGQDPLPALGTWCSPELSLDRGTWPVALGTQELSRWPRLARGTAPSAAPLGSARATLRGEAILTPSMLPARFWEGKVEAEHDGVKSCGNRAPRGAGLGKGLWCFCCERGGLRRGRVDQEGREGPAGRPRSCSPSRHRASSSIIPPEPRGLSCADPHPPDPSLAQSRCPRKGMRGGGGRGFPWGVTQPPGAAGPPLLPPTEAPAVRV